MTDEERKAFRRKLGRAVLDIQAATAADMPVVVFLPEMISALLSLAAYMTNHNAQLGKHDWHRMSRMAALEQWPAPPKP